MPRVKAKRAGWDQPEGIYTATDWLEPPAWMDAGLDAEIEGELEVEDVPASKYVNAYKRYSVNGESVDPATIVSLDGSPLEGLLG
jgi:hypothetical protein